VKKGGNMSKRHAKELFDKLKEDPELQAKIKLGLETLAKIAGDYDVTEEELTNELRKRWQCRTPGVPYSEPPGF
jgi:hypothetical protein